MARARLTHTLPKASSLSAPELSNLDALQFGLDNVIEAVEDSAVVRFGSYAAMAGGALVFLPVATIFVVSTAGFYASLWGARQLVNIGKQSARAVIGLPPQSALQPVNTAQPPLMGAFEADSAVLHTPADIDALEEF